MKRPNIVLFLGAGFSAAFNHPVMTAFADAVRVHSRVDDEHQRMLAQLIRDARQANSFLQSDPKNIEDILSFAEMRDRLDLNEGGGSAEHVKRTLGAIYSTYPEGQIIDTMRTKLANLIGYEADDRRRAETDCRPNGLSIVTTNYDLNAEYALIWLGCQVRLGWKAEAPIQIGGHGIYYQTSSDAVPIFKLHGAVNWFAGSAEDRNRILVDGQRAASATGVISVSVGGAVRARVADYSTGEDRVPVIIPPSFLKPELSAAMRSVWAGAARALSEANYVVFIGYSFPPTDREMAYFLAASLSDNADLSRIFIVDPDAEGILKRLQEGRFGNHFIKFVTTVSDRWQLAKRLQIPFAWQNRPN